MCVCILIEILPCEKPTPCLILQMRSCGPLVSLKVQLTSLEKHIKAANLQEFARTTSNNKGDHRFMRRNKTKCAECNVTYPKTEYLIFAKPGRVYVLYFEKDNKIISQRVL